MNRLTPSRRHLLAGAASLLLSGVITEANAADRPIRVMIIDGVGNHDWKMTTRLLRAILEPTGLFAVSVSTSPATADAPGWDVWRPDFKACDVVLQTYNDLGGGPDWPDAVKRQFETYVRDGGGVFYLHSANNAFEKWPEYNEMIGLAWRKKDFGPAVYIDSNEHQASVPANVGEDTGHGPRFDALVTRIGDHPVHKGLPRQWMTADVELYRYARGPGKNLTVLSYAMDPKTQMNWPMEWQVNYGKGRGYIANYGHVWLGDIQPPTMRSADVQVILIRALQWLSGRAVTYPIPADFPTQTATSIRPELAI